VTNASLVSGLRTDVDLNSALTSNLQANTISLAADISSNTNRVSVLETGLASNATLLSNTTARVTVVEQNTSNLSNLTNTVTEHTTDILDLEQSVHTLDMLAGAMDGNSTALTSLTAAGTAWALNIYGAYDKLATKVRVGNVESVLETQFGDDLANLTSGNTSSDVSADINALKDVVNLENWGNLLGVDVVLSSPGNIGAPLTSNVIRFNDALFGTSNTSVCAALKSNVSNLQAFQSNTTNLLSNIQSELFTHDTLLALHSNDLADNVLTISNLSTSLTSNANRITDLTSNLADNSSRITSLTSQLTSNSNRISTLENAGSGAVWMTSGNDIYYNSGDVSIGATNARGKLDIYTGATSTAGLIIDRYSSGTYRSELYQESNGLAIKVGNGSSAPSEIMRVTASSIGVGAPTPRARIQIGKHIPNNSGTNNTIPSSNMGQNADMPNSTHLWMANRFTSTEEDYWGLAMGVLWDGHSYLQSVNKKTSSVYNLLLQPNGGSVGISTATFTDTRNEGGLHLANSKGISFAASTNSNSRHWRIRTDDYSDHGSLQIGVSGDNSTCPDAAGEAVMTMTRDRYCGIGTSQPAVPLHVNATASASVGSTHVWIASVTKSGGQNWDGKFGTHVANTSHDYSIKASGAVGSTRFIIGSDERIKKDIVDVQDDEALVKLRMLHPKKYRFIDESARGDQQVYGYLANEVQEVLPDAILEHPEEVPSIYQLANVSNSSIITFSDFDTSKLQSNTLVAIGIDQLRHKLTVDEIIDSTSVRVIEDLSSLSGSLDEHGNVVTETHVLSITPEEYEELEDKTGFEPVSDDSNVISEYTKTTTTYVGDQLFVYGEEVTDFKHLQESAISTLSTAALQEVDRIQQQHDAQIADLEATVASRDQQIDELRGELNDIVSRLESLEA
jgi:hypothetical protein